MGVDVHFDPHYVYPGEHSITPTFVEKGGTYRFSSATR
tara:strand:- start:430 stop:543 length:114 start_codon:yes stop_codon:yes gene_type:complete